MRRTSRSRAGGAFVLGATAGVAACALLTTNLLGSRAVQETVDRLGDLTLPPAAAAEELHAFDDCSELRSWYAEAALPHVGPFGWDGTHLLRGGLDGPVAVAEARGFATASGHSAFPPPGGDNVPEVVGNSDTGTNVQEVGVDEPDQVKTDGSVLARTRRGHLRVFDVTGAQPRLLSTVDIPGGSVVVQELLLVGDTALVLARRAGWGAGPWPVDVMPSGTAPFTPPDAVTFVTQVDLGNPSDPAVVSHRRLDGDLVAAREYGDGTVRLVTTTGLPPLDFVHPNRDRSPRQAERENRAIVRAAGIDDWLPGVRTDGGQKQPVLSCADVRHPERQSGFGTITVLTLDIENPATMQATAVTAGGELVYSSTERLYVATLETAWGPGRIAADGVRRRPVPRTATTTVHAFDLTGGGATYTASGRVRGTVRDRWSFDEQDGRLRVATALGPSWSPRENAVSVLEEQGPELVTVGSVTGLGPRESIQSVRWFDDLAVVVTFRQTDPLYTVDLSDPTRPRVAGELKIPGFSAYLHPLGGDRLLGLGQDATLTGRTLGAQAATFDVRDLSGVVRTDTHSFGRGTEMPVGWEPRTFSYLPGRALALVPYESWRTGRRALVALHVGLDGTLEVRRTWPLGPGASASVRTLPLPDGRFALVDRGVRIVDLG